LRKSDNLEPHNFEPHNFESSGETGQGAEGHSYPARSHQIESLRQHQMRGRWRLSLILWLTLGLLSLWTLRFEFQELYEYFTWAAVRAMLAFNRLAALGLGICFGLTTALLYAESRHILWGLSKAEEEQLTARLSKIQAQGSSHPHWRLIAPAQTAEKEA